MIASQRNVGARDQTFCLWSSGDRIIYAGKKEQHTYSDCAEAVGYPFVNENN